MTLNEILNRLLPCRHKWEEVDKVKVYSVTENGHQIGHLPKRYDYILKCKICGDVTKRRV